MHLQLRFLLVGLLMDFCMLIVLILLDMPTFSRMLIPLGEIPSRTQKDKMTKLLIAVIVEFAEPYFVRVARRKQQERDKLLLLQQQKKQRIEEKQMTKKKHSQSTVLQDECQSSSFGFDERAISWASTCIKQLLQLTSPSILLPNTSSTTVNQLNNDTMNDHLDDGHIIPELDALLSASGEHDGMKMEECVQSALLQGLQSHRLLQQMGISRFNRKVKIDFELGKSDEREFCLSE